MVTGSGKSPVPHHTVLSIEVLLILGIVLALQSSAVPIGFQDGASNTVPPEGWILCPFIVIGTEVAKGSDSFKYSLRELAFFCLSGLSANG